MKEVFLEVININILGSYLILAVILIRLLVRKAPPNMICFLWVLVGIRFLIPFSFESVFSLIPSVRIVRENASYVNLPVVDTGITPVDKQINQYLVQNYDTVTEKMQPVMVICGYVWLAGMILMLGYYFYSWYSLRRKISTALPEEIFGEKVYRSDAVPAPFLMGIVSPRIYLPMELSKEELFYVIAHEKAHKERYDYLIKPIACLLFIVYWFNPLLWISYTLLCRDIEYACDERVIRKLGEEHKKKYVMVLLSCSMERRRPNLCPVAFAEAGVKGRIIKVLNYRKPVVWVTVAAAFLCIMAVLCFMTQKKAPSQDGSIIEYDGYRIILESAVVCEETEGAIINYRITSDIRNDKELAEFSQLSIGLAGRFGMSVNENGDYEIAGDGFYTGSKSGLRAAFTLSTREGIEIGSFDPALAYREDARNFKIDSEIGKAEITIAPHFMTIEFENGIPDKKQCYILVMDMKQGEKWKVTRVPMQVSSKSDTVSYDQEVWIGSGMQNEEQKKILLTFEEPVNIDDIEGFFLILNNE